MIDKLWYQPTKAAKYLTPLLWPLSRVFHRVSQSRREAYQSGRKSSYRAPVPVVVVGNITVGGNGKTPVVIWLVEQLQALGFRPGVVSRGYGGNAKHYPLLVTNDVTAEQCGDEPKLIAQRTGAPVAVAPVRSQAVKALLEHKVDVVITDDGLQHYALQRDIELVVVDGKRRFGNQNLLPLGPLREPISRLEEVDFIINNGGVTQGSEISMSLEPSLAVNLSTGEQRDVRELGKLVAFAGIGHPPRFFHTLEQLGAEVIASQGFADHQAYDKNQLETFAQQGQNVIMTEKDAVKCGQFAQDNWWYLPVSAKLPPQSAERILRRIKEVKQEYGSPFA
ncbi:tetraacyldisaccharide 4'-kinase [Vibrio sp. WXL210]|uniref:tetraacyldisaccharide 4'-kinase n=1 Tax=Vibrio sp. WXL210 TaxID=3450709 RepID=UPI003EC83CF0